MGRVKFNDRQVEKEIMINEHHKTNLATQGQRQESLLQIVSMPTICLNLCQVCETAANCDKLHY